MELVNSTAIGPLTRISGDLQFKDDKPFRFGRNTHLNALNSTSMGGRATRRVRLPVVRLGWREGETDFLRCTRRLPEIGSSVGQSPGRATGVFPTVEGGVLVEWTGYARIRSVEIMPDGTYEMFSLEKASARVNTSKVPREPVRWS